MNRNSDDELRIFQEAWQYLAEHHDPPGPQDPESEAWWIAAAKAMRAADLRWKGNPLLRSLLSALYNYLGGIAKAHPKS